MFTYNCINYHQVNMIDQIECKSSDLHALYSY